MTTNQSPSAGTDAGPGTGTGTPDPTSGLPPFWTPADLAGMAPSLRGPASDLAGMFAQIDAIGHIHAEDGADAGYARFAWTMEEAWLRVWFAAQMIERGFTVDVDPTGNQWAWIGGAASAERPGVTVGSHLDSVPGGGAFDGPLGTLSAIAAWDALRREGFEPPCPVGVTHWHDEEGARFAIACFGSRTLTGILPADRALARVDADGITYAQALESFPAMLDQVRDLVARAKDGEADVPAIAATLAGFDDSIIARAIEASAAPRPDGLRAAPDWPARSAAHIELHVEQGCAQADLDAPVAVADRIWPHGRWRIDIDGEANHAGATPMDRRHDPMLAFAAFVRAVHEEAVRLGVRATIGRVEAVPGGVNVIPGRVTCWLDARADDARKLTALVAALEHRAEEGQFDTGLTVSNQINGDTGLAVSTQTNGDTGLAVSNQINGDTALAVSNQTNCDTGLKEAVHDFRMIRESWTEPTVFSPELRDRLAKTLDAPVIGTAAGHDAGILAESGHTAGMIFVRNRTGASHTPAEFATLADCARGVRAYADAIRACSQAIAHDWRPQA